MENALPPQGKGAVVVVVDSPLSSKSAPLGKPLFERDDGSRFALGGATADLLILLIDREGVTATCL